MAITVKRTGFGQVEPNHLSAQRTSQIYAQLPAAKTIDILENGQFVKYNYADGVTDFEGVGEWMMVFNEVKLYDDRWRESYKDYAMQRKNFTGYYDEDTKTVIGEMVPRVIKTNVGDIYTTNCVGAANTDGKAEYEGIELSVKDTVAPDANGYMVKTDDGDMLWEVVAETTMPDGQPAVKLMRIK